MVLGKDTSSLPCRLLRRQINLQPFRFHDVRFTPKEQAEQLTCLQSTYDVDKSMSFKTSLTLSLVNSFPFRGFRRSWSMSPKEVSQPYHTTDDVVLQFYACFDGDQHPQNGASLLQNTLGFCRRQNHVKPVLSLFRKCFSCLLL